MPNWVTIRLMITGPAGSLKKFREENAYRDTDEEGKPFERALSFNHLIPFPKELEGTTSPVRDTTSPEERARLVSLYGADNWYDWKIHNWGTKWDAHDVSVSDNDSPLEYDFTTAWSLPEPWLELLPATYPELSFTLLAGEEGGAFYIKMEAGPDAPDWDTTEYTEDEWHRMHNEDYAAVAYDIEKLPYGKFVAKYAVNKVWNDDYPTMNLEEKILARFKDKDLPTLVGHEWAAEDNQEEFERRLKGR